MPELGTSGSVGGPGWATTQVYPSSVPLTIDTVFGVRATDSRLCAPSRRGALVATGARSFVPNIAEAVRNLSLKVTHTTRP
jgi:hypothetical protein